MSRVIKYRAFDKNSKQMVEVLQIAFSFTDPDGNLYEERIRVIDKNGWKYWLDEGQYELMEFSGILDKNGREVYEGDIILLGGNLYDIYYKHGDKVLVEWDECMTGFIPFQSAHSDYDPICGSMAEVIGNIHENPELLKAGES